MTNRILSGPWTRIKMTSFSLFPAGSERSKTEAAERGSLQGRSIQINFAVKHKT